MKANALPVYVFRSALGDCTNGGISSRFDQLLVLCPDGCAAVDLDNPPENLCKIVKRHLFDRDVYHVEPVAQPSGVGWMSGGNYAASSDSRFSAMFGHQYGALAIHDRTESQREYNLLSR